MHAISKKNLIIEVDGQKFARYPIKTHFIRPGESLEKIFSNYALPFTRESDIVILCQKIVSILQKQIIRKEDVKIGFWAKSLAKFVKKTPAGFGVGNPYKMQVAINLAGLPRILLAALIGGLCKIFRIYGVFYKIAGNQVSQIDGFYGKAFKEYENIGILGPKNCDKICEGLRNKFNLSFAVADVNDLGGNILGKSSDLARKENLLLKILKDNPAGQENQQTPIIIIREVND